MDILLMHNMSPIFEQTAISQTLFPAHYQLFIIPLSIIFAP